MKYLLDTCVVSELIKPKPDNNVVMWMKQQDEETLFLSVLTIGEIEKGIAKLADGAKKRHLSLWVEDDLKKRFEGRIISIDLKVASKWGKVQGLAESLGKALPSIDGLIAASALSYNCTVVSRNVDDMELSGVAILNPWLDADA